MNDFNNCMLIHKVPSPLSQSCTKFFEAIRSASDPVTVITDEKYDTIFTYIWPKLGAENPVLLMFTHLIPNNIMRIILIHRKMTKFSYRMYDTLSSIKNDADIMAFFSLYNHKEIMRIIMKYDNCIFKGKHIRDTFIIHCATCGNNVLVKFCLEYLREYNLSSIIYTDAIRNPFQGTKLYDSGLLYEHEKMISFDYSLRYAWMTCCIII